MLCCWTYLLSYGILNYDPVRLLIESMALSEEQRVSSVSWSIIIFNLDLWKKIPSLFCYWDNGKKFQLYFSCSCDYFKVEQIVTFPTLQQYWHLDHLERAMKDSLEALLCPSINNVYCTTLIPVSSFHALKIFLKKETGNYQNNYQNTCLPLFSYNLYIVIWCNLEAKQWRNSPFFPKS